MSENEAPAADPLAPPDRISNTEWTRLSTVNPAEARRYYDEGRVDFPEHIRQSLQARRDEARPLGFTGAAEHIDYLNELSRRETMTQEERKQWIEEQTEARKAEPEMSMEEQVEYEAAKREAAEMGRISHTEWNELSETDPATAMKYHRYGLVDYPDYIARNLEANRRRPLGA